MKKESHMILAHFNPQELEVLDKLQGRRTNVKGSKVRHYKDLDDILRNDEHYIKKQYEEHAKGGHIGEMLKEADMMRAKGRRGDTDVAFIAPHTRRVFDYLLNGGSVNPHTNMPEYYGFGRMLNGVGRSISHGFRDVGRFGRKVLGMGNGHNAGSNIASMVPGALVGGLMGGPAGAMAGAAEGFLSNSMQGQGKSENPMKKMKQFGQDSMQQFGQNAMNQAQGYGQNMMDQAQGYGQKMMNKAQKYGNKKMNQAQNYVNQAQNYGQNMMDQAQGYGQNMYNQGQDMYNQGRNTMNQMQDYGRNMYNQGQNMYNQGQDMYNQMQSYNPNMYNPNMYNPNGGY